MTPCHRVACARIPRQIGRRIMARDRGTFHRPPESRGVKPPPVARSSRKFQPNRAMRAGQGWRPHPSSNVWRAPANLGALSRVPPLNQGEHLKRMATCRRLGGAHARRRSGAECTNSGTDSNRHLYATDSNRHPADGPDVFKDRNAPGRPICNVSADAPRGRPHPLVAQSSIARSLHGEDIDGAALGNLRIFAGKQKV